MYHWPCIVVSCCIRSFLGWYEEGTTLVILLEIHMIVKKWLSIVYCIKSTLECYSKVFRASPPGQK